MFEVCAAEMELAFYPLSCSRIVQKCKFTLLFQICMRQKIELNYPSQFALLLALLGLGIIVGNTIVLGIGSQVLHTSMKSVPALMNNPQNTNIARFLNTLASFLVFGLPTLILGYIVNLKPFEFLGFQAKISSKQLLLVILIAFCGLFLSGALGEINQLIPLPAKWLAAAKEAEARYKESMMAMITMKTVVDYVLALLVMAAAPAIFEEILFRGALQKIFVGWTKNAFVGILIASILFSAIHFSFFGFLPRVALGLILGYVFYFSKNIWYNILIHFLYNGIIVTQLYLATKQGKQIDKAIDESTPIWMGLLAIIALLFLLRLFKDESVLANAEKSKEIENN